MTEFGRFNSISPADLAVGVCRDLWKMSHFFVVLSNFVPWLCNSKTLKLLFFFFFLFAML